MGSDVVSVADKRRAVLWRRFWVRDLLPMAVVVSFVLNELHTDDLFPEPLRIAAYVFISAVAVWRLSRFMRRVRARRRRRDLFES
jgi:hypothetical protein